MFHLEMRMGIGVVREFNLSDERLWLQFLAPLMADREFSIEGHEFIPRQTRIKIYEGPQLRPDQLGLGRGWQNVERTAADVTERVMRRAREHAAATSTATAPPPTPADHGTPEASAVAAPPPTPADPGAPTAPAAPAATELLRERLHGRIAAGPLAAPEILATTAELMPAASERERHQAAREAAWALIERGVAQLAPAPSDR